MKFVEILTLSHPSLCCLRNFSTSEPEWYDRNRAMSSRLGYLFGIFLVGIICFFAHYFSESMFFFILHNKFCSENTLVWSCFSIQMIYRISFAMTCYHFIMMVISCINVAAVNRWADFCWILKVMTAFGFFFIACVMPNGFFKAWGFVCMIVSVIAFPIKIAYMIDSLRFFASSDPITPRRKCPMGVGIGFGVLFFILGLGIFILIFIWEHDHLRCTAHLVTAIIMCVAAFVIFFIFAASSIVAKQGGAMLAGGMFFFAIAVGEWGLTAATSHSPCKNVLNVNVTYEKAVSGLEILFNLFFLIPGFIFLGRVDLSEYFHHSQGSFSVLAPLHVLLQVNLVAPRTTAYPATYDSALLGYQKAANLLQPIFNRQGNQGLFHFLCMAFSCYIGMACNSWIQPLFYKFTPIDILTRDLLWIRFSSLCLACVFAFFSALLSFIRKPRGINLR